MADPSEEAEAARQDLRVQISDLDKLIDGKDERSPAAKSNSEPINSGVGRRLSDISVIGDRYGFTLSDQRDRPLVTFSYPTQSHAAGALCLIENALRDALIVRENADWAAVFMALQTQYIFQSFIADGAGGLKGEQPKVCKNAQDATQRAQSQVARKLGVVAFSISGDSELGEYDEKPSVLFKAGRTPSEFEAWD